MGCRDQVGQTWKMPISLLSCSKTGRGRNKWRSCKFVKNETRGLLVNSDGKRGRSLDKRAVAIRFLTNL